MARRHVHHRCRTRHQVPATPPARSDAPIARPQRGPPQEKHRHSGIGLHTPASVHYGTATEVRTQRAVTLEAAYAANPGRFRHRRPSPPKLPTVAWINKPTIGNDAQKNG
jgi:hypothetical protein